jgi:beta-glucosidase
MARDIELLIADLTLDEKASLTAGEDLWSTVAVERLGIPKVRVTDGPNGARGTTLPGQGATPSTCIPCGSALGATWNTELVEEVGALLGEETRAKGCRVLLAPTVNIHRSPLAGRNFECYSEDPLLAGKLAAAYIRGVQSRSVATTVKHFAGNDAEYQRFTMNSMIDERALREIYLVPFELAVREGGTLGVMTAYNRLNGEYCGEHEWLLTSVLRGEWGFAGFVLSDWYAIGSTAGSAEAGLDLQMPGPPRFFGPPLADAVRAGDVDEALVDAQARRLLSVFDRLGALDDPPEPGEASTDRPEHRALARRAAAEATVLLQNDGVLPLPVDGLRSLAVIGPNAARAQVMGGGSANLTPWHRTSPLAAIQARIGHAVDVRHAPGADIDASVTALDTEFSVALFTGPDWDGPVTAEKTRRSGEVLFFGEPAPGVPADAFSFRATARYTPEVSGPHEFRLVQSGRARLLVDGQVLLDGVVQPPPPGHELYGMGSQVMAASIGLKEGTGVEVVVEYTSRHAGAVRGVKVGCRPAPGEDLIGDAVVVAAACDAAVVVVGTTDQWESEGRDRASMGLPGEQDELVRRVLAANPRTVVVLNTGSPVATPWAAEAPAILQSWFGGQEMAEALVDILTGDADPGGRLPTTFPAREEHNPSFGNFPGENSRIRYGEGVLVGYRWYEARHLPVAFPFGHGLSYTTFAFGAPRVSAEVWRAGETIAVDVPVINTGDRRGAEVVQCYVAPPSAGRARVVRPPQELKAFAKVWLDPGESATVTLHLSDRSFAYWDPGDPDWQELAPRLATAFPFPPYSNDPKPTPGWRVDPGRYELRIGRSSADIAHTVEVTVGETV